MGKVDNSKYEQIVQRDWKYQKNFSSEEFIKERFAGCRGFALEIDKESLRACELACYSEDYPEIVDEESKGICSNYDLWYMLFDMGLFPEFSEPEPKTIAECAMHHNGRYMIDLICFVALCYEKELKSGKYLPFSYRYYQIRADYLIENSPYNIDKKVIFVPVRRSEPNATSTGSKGDSFLVKINVGLEYVLDRINRLISYALIPLDGIDYINYVMVNLHIELTLITLFFYGRIKASQVAGAFITQYGDMNECRQRRIEQMDFIVCHELGHIYNNDIEKETTKEMELAADDFAWEVLSSKPDERNIYGLRSERKIAQSVLLMFRMFDIIEKLYDRICRVKGWTFEKRADDHPSYSERYDNVLDKIGTTAAYSTCMTRVLGLLDFMEKSLIEHDESYLIKLVDAQLKIDLTDLKKCAKMEADKCTMN